LVVGSLIDRLPLLALDVYVFRVGGLEYDVVNLVNSEAAARFRHVIVAHTDSCPDFRARVTREDVDFVDLAKPPGHGFRLYRQIVALFRSLRPAVVHTRNLAALEAQLPARIPRGPVRIHGHHASVTWGPHGPRRRS